MRQLNAHGFYERLNLTILSKLCVAMALGGQEKHLAEIESFDLNS